MAVEGVYLGFDLSTQQLKLAATDGNLQLIYETAVKFDVELPEFKTVGGAHVHDDKVTVTVPALMWVKAFDLCLDKMKQDGFVFSRVLAVSCDAQQHGSVYWSIGAEKLLETLDSGRPLHEQLSNAFAVSDSPIWRDGSTDYECKMMENAAGGALALAELTGARSFHRFTGPQISKIHRLYPEKYQDTERISLVSSFAASLLLGRYAPIDHADGSGMNLMELKQKVWIPELMQACAPNLAEKLGETVACYTKLGKVSKFYVERYGFNDSCEIVASTGDNLASVAGLRLQPGEIIVSLGTGDTIFLSLSQPKANLFSCQIASPVLSDSYVALLCFKNGSLTRERVMTERANGSWDKFNHLMLSTPKGNQGNIGIYFDIREITPKAAGIYRFDNHDLEVCDFDAGTEIRAVIEGQLLAKRMYAELCGIDIASSTRIIATGGASANKVLLQTLADIFNSPVYTIDVPNSASLGNCYRAKHGLLGGADVCDFFSLVPELQGLACAAKPDPDALQIYTAMLERYRRLEDYVVQRSNQELIDLS